MSEQPVTITYPLSDFLQWQGGEQLELTPRFQRRQVWQTKARSYLIDTILRQMPIPPIFIRLILDTKKRRTIRQVVDGQQRLRAIFDFIKGDLTVIQAHNPEYAGMTFGDLPEEAQQKFLSYKLAVNILEAVSDSDVLRIFARLNTYTVPLNAQELRNAEYFGPFKQTVYDLAYQHLAFWRKNNVITDQRISRMDDAELVSELLVTMMDGFQSTKDKELRKYYNKYDDDFPKAEKLRQQFEKTIDTIGAIFDTRLSQTPFRRAPLFFSLFLVIYDLLFGLPGETSSRLSFSKRERDCVFEATTRLGEIVVSKTPPERYATFVDAARRATADAERRRVRHRFLRDAIMENVRQRKLEIQ